MKYVANGAAVGMSLGFCLAIISPNKTWSVIGAALFMASLLVLGVIIMSAGVTVFFRGRRNQSAK